MNSAAVCFWYLKRIRELVKRTEIHLIWCIITRSRVLYLESGEDDVTSNYYYFVENTVGFSTLNLTTVPLGKLSIM
jgi:hypothetical protein